VGLGQQTRSEVLARHGMVATSQPLAAEAGLQGLRDGGNAVDAAVATAAMLGLTEPESAGIGGAYSIFRNPDLARAHELLAKDGPDPFYRGPIGHAIVRRMNVRGAAWRMSDLSSFKSQWVKPISTTYKGYDVFQMPPQTQGSRRSRC
jgi:gamma-glutamyltranspeptidase